MYFSHYETLLLLHDNTCAMFSPSSRGHAKVLGAYYDGQDTMYVTQGDTGGKDGGLALLRPSDIIRD